MRIKYLLGSILLNAVYNPTKYTVCDFEQKEILYAELNPVTDYCFLQDTIVVMGDFSMVSGTDGRLQAVLVLTALVPGIPRVKYFWTFYFPEN